MNRFELISCFQDIELKTKDTVAPEEKSVGWKGVKIFQSLDEPHRQCGYDTVTTALNGKSSNAVPF